MMIWALSFSLLHAAVFVLLIFFNAGTCLKRSVEFLEANWSACNSRSSLNLCAGSLIGTLGSQSSIGSLRCLLGYWIPSVMILFLNIIHAGFLLLSRWKRAFIPSFTLLFLLIALEAHLYLFHFRFYAGFYLLVAGSVIEAWVIEWTRCLLLKHAWSVVVMMNSRWLGFNSRWKRDCCFCFRWSSRCFVSIHAGSVNFIVALRLKREFLA